MLDYLFSPKGRIGRLWFWLGILSSAVLFPVLLISIESYADNNRLLEIVVIGLYFWITSCLLVKRLHDMNASAWYLIIALLIPLAGIVIGVIPGTVGSNDFGPDPRAKLTA